MNIAEIREVLLWCAILNIGIVTVWAILILVAKGWLNGMVLRWFRVSAEHWRQDQPHGNRGLQGGQHFVVHCAVYCVADCRVSRNG